MSRNYNSHAYEYEFFRTIKPAFSYDGGEDFFEWQKKARAKLNELLGLPFENVISSLRSNMKRILIPTKNTVFPYKRKRDTSFRVTWLFPK